MSTKMRFLTQLRSFRRNESGGIMVAFCLIAVTLLTAVGASVDLARVLSTRSMLRSAADSAALAAASLYMATSSERITVAQNTVAANVGSQVSSTVTPTVTFTGDIVTVSLATDVPTTLMRVVNVPQVATGAKASAKIVAGPPICILALDSNEQGAIDSSGTATTDLTGCNVMNNSSHPSAYHGNGNSIMKADQFCGVGGYDNKNSYNPTPKSGCKAIPDPYAGLPHPITGGCDFTKTKVKTTTTLVPGIYCDDLVISASGHTVTLSPGTYIIKDGSLSVSSGKVIGAGVTFYFIGTDTGFDIKNEEFTVSAPTTGPYAGILFFQNPTSNPGAQTKIQGGGIINMTGVMYLPTWTANVTGGGEINKLSNLFGIVAYKIFLNGNGKIFAKSDPAAAGMPNILPALRGSARLIN